MTSTNTSSDVPRDAATRRPIPYRRHNCTSSHRTNLAAAKCIWKRAAWIIGNGPYATVSRCRPGVTTVMLHPDQQHALDALEDIAAYGCGGVCCGDHQYVLIAVAP